MFVPPIFFLKKAKKLFLFFCVHILFLYISFPFFSFFFPFPKIFSSPFTTLSFMKVRSSSRGLKITSLVVLSPVLLILFSLVYIFLVFIYSNIMSWCHPTIQPLSSQSSLSRVATSSTVSIYHHHCSSKLPQLTILKRVNFFSRLRQSPLVWCVLIKDGLIFF
jgi:hypothetical protein